VIMPNLNATRAPPSSHLLLVVGMLSEGLERKQEANSSLLPAQVPASPRRSSTSHKKAEFASTSSKDHLPR